MDSKKKTAESQRSVSIAWKMTWSFIGRLFVILAVIDVIVLGAVVLIFCYTQEKSVLQDAWQWRLERQVSDWVYQFSLPGQSIYTVDLSVYRIPLMIAGWTVGGSELLFLAAEIPHSVRRARRYLRPLDEMAAATRRLAQMEASSRQQGSKIREAEDAISHFSPNQPDARLQTGDRDLSGIENAVNTLLARIHQSYQQQIRFVSDASHELRTPIAVIQGYAGMLDRWGKEDEEILEESIHAILQESENMKKLVEQLLFLARGDSGRNHLTFEELSLNALAKEVYEETRMIDQEHSWELETRDEAVCRADAALLKQAFRILVDNAGKYTPKGERIFIRAYVNEEQWPCIEVQDSGIGMNAQDAEHIFERFYRADQARGRQNGGSGLGLAIAKWIVDRHDGYFQVLSREEFGTRITMVLPPCGGEELNHE